MKELARIKAVYSKLDLYLEQERFKGTEVSAAKIETEQVLNDQAYFILCWGQFETTVNDHCRDAIRRRCSHADWQIRRAWDIYNPDDPRLSGLSFESRAALVLDRSEGRGKPFALAMRHYDTRNRIAHGKLMQIRIDLVSVIHDFYLIQSALHRAG